MTTNQKLSLLKETDSDFEWYPSTPEIMEAMSDDLWAYLRKHKNDYSARDNNNKERVSIKEEDGYSGKSRKSVQRLDIDSFLDIGAGDGRVLEFFNARNKYGIEIARAQADDLIRKGIFIVGRNYWDVSLHDNDYALIFSNPPYSQFVPWVNKLLLECNFHILYLVMPVRWTNQKEITRELKRYETSVVGEFDFSNADREARGKVNLVRVNAPWKKVEGERANYETTIENAFERYVRENIADFEDKNYHDDWEEEKETEVALKKAPIDQLLSDYEAERENLSNAFRAIGKLNAEIIKLMGQDKNSMLEIIRKSIKGLKKKYWRATFDKLEPVQKRMTFGTRKKIFESIDEFKTLDFNADNVYSVVIWIINNTNVGILEQIGEVFDALTSVDFIEKYVSNKHWSKSDWRNGRDDYKYSKLPERWKLGLDYRIVVETHNQLGMYARRERRTIIDDFIIICRNLGFPIAADNDDPDYWLQQTEQKFFTEAGELAFTMRYYTGNQNAHLKINKRLLMKFNVEVAKIRKWMSDPGDIVDEYAVTESEAAALWNSPIALLGMNDVRKLEYFKETA